MSALTPTEHAADRDDADQRQQLRPAPAAQVAPRDRQLELGSFGPHRRKEDHVADVRRVREIHEQPVDADADAAHRRHAVLHRAQIVLVHARRFVVARGRSRACASNRRRWSIGSFSSLNAFASSLPAREQLEPLGERRIAALRLRERRQLDRIVDDERRLVRASTRRAPETSRRALRPAQRLRPCRRRRAAPPLRSVCVVASPSRPRRAPR